jgi:hypothetical protein
VFGGVVNAIMVCFAERPSALEKSHPVSLLYPTSNDVQNLPYSTQKYFETHLDFTGPIQNVAAKLASRIARRNQGAEDKEEVSN